MVVRPVDVSPLQNAFPVVDPATGRATSTFQRFLLNLWERTGGFTDEFFEVLTVANLGTIQGLIATGQNEALERALGDVAAQGRLNSVDRLSQEIASLAQQLNIVQGFAASSLRGPIPTRVVIFTQNDTWQLNPDIKCLSVFAVGGGGGGGGGTGGAQGGGGGGGANYSMAFIEASQLPATIAVTVGAAGAAGAGGGGAGGNGGDSSFGGFVAALGGKGAGAGGTGGAANEIYGGMFQGGPGGTGASGGSDGDSALNDFAGAPGGGGGGLYAGTPSVGGSGGTGNGRSLLAEGGGGSGGIGGGVGGSNPVSQTLIGPGFGGGGGGATLVTAGAGGDGYNGAGGGGGGGNSAGGNGGEGRVWVVEYY